jgi:hypothetical protein
LKQNSIAGIGRLLLAALCWSRRSSGPLVVFSLFPALARSFESALGQIPDRGLGSGSTSGRV